MNMDQLKKAASELGWPCLSYSFQSMALLFISLSTPAPYSALAGLMSVLSGIISIGMKGKTFAQISDTFSAVSPGMGWNRRNEAVVVCLFLIVISGAATTQSTGTLAPLSHLAVVFACLAGWAALNDKPQKKA